MLGKVHAETLADIAVIAKAHGEVNIDPSERFCTSRETEGETEDLF